MPSPNIPGLEIVLNKTCNTESNKEKKRQRNTERDTNLKIIILVDICSSVLLLDKSKRKQMTKKRKSYNTKYRIIDIQYK